MTEAGVLKGKLSYIAPEQLDGEATPATDIYAAAVSLYEAVGFTRCEPWGEYLDTPDTSRCYEKSLSA